MKKNIITKMFEEKWERFIEHEGKGYDIVGPEIIYIKDDNTFYLRGHTEYLKLKINDKELRNKIKKISTIH